MKLQNSKEQPEQEYLQASFSESKLYSATPFPSFLIKMMQSQIKNGDS